MFILDLYYSKKILNSTSYRFEESSKKLKANNLS